jgi:hypothetical protein
MTDESLLRRIAALEEQVAELSARVSARVFEKDVRLGPPPETSEEIAARTNALITAVQTAMVEAEVEALEVDRTKLCTTDGRPVAEARASQTNPTGQHPSYIVLCEEERAKGFVRPYRDQYRHTPCGTTTTMGRALSETYARDPTFYSHTFCCHCNVHRPVAEFVWTADGQPVGS